MTTPASGTISIGNIINEFDTTEGNPYYGLGYQGSGYSLDFLRDEILGAGAGAIALGTSFYSKTLINALSPASISGTSWNNAIDVVSSDGTTSIDLLYNSQGDSILATNWGFSVPNTKTIRGIQVTIASHWYDQYGSDGNPLHQIYVNLTKNGSTSVGDTFIHQPYYDSSNFTFNYSPNGSSIDYPLHRHLWNTTWTYTDINSANFGVIITPEKVDGDEINSTTIWVGYLRLRVHYD